MRVPMRLAFDKMNLHRLWLHVFDFNPRAIASYEKCGFKREGVMREDRFHRGRYHDTIVMGILAEEYRALIRRD
ncbi:MAG TPA: GNAT family protein [Candidatus Binataceae bacterium]